MEKSHAEAATVRDKWGSRSLKNNQSWDLGRGMDEPWNTPLPCRGHGGGYIIHYRASGMQWSVVARVSVPLLRNITPPVTTE